jgi:O-antigen/teichoic acid export membrane protein
LSFERRLRPFMSKVLASIVDQATSSTANFVMNVLLARWLSPTDYGSFSVSWSFCLVFAAFHNAIVLEPMSVVGPAEYGLRLRGYLRSVRKLNVWVVLTLGGCAALTGVFYQTAQVRQVLFVLALCLPGYLLVLTRRREQYVLDRPLQALEISGVYAVTVLGTLNILHATSHLTPVTGLACIGVALPVALWAGIRRSHPKEASDGEVRPIARAHWKYGRWLLASTLVAFGIPDLQTILLSVMVDLKSAGALRALMNFVLPLAQLLTVLSIYCLPRLARQMKQHGAGRGLRQTIVFPLAIIVTALGYLGVLLAFAPLLERVLYGGRMAQYLGYLPWLAAAALLSALGAGFSALLRAAQNSQHQLLAGVTGTATGVIAALLLLKRYGLEGAIWSMLLANAVSTLSILGTYLWMIRRQRASWSHAFHYFRLDF